jgi:hypothetical protein
MLVYTIQMERIANGEKELSAFDMAGHFRSFEMGSGAIYLFRTINF